MFVKKKKISRHDILLEDSNQIHTAFSKFSRDYSLILEKKNKTGKSLSFFNPETLMNSKKSLSKKNNISDENLNSEDDETESTNLLSHLITTPTIYSGKLMKINKFID